jgi:naphthoate synthase
MTDTVSRLVPSPTWTRHDGQAAMMQFAGSATLMYYTTDEGREGKEAFLEKRKPDFARFKRYP